MKFKKVTAVILALCMVVALSACGGSPATTPNESENTPNTDDVPLNDATVLKIGHIAPDNDEGYNEVCLVMKEYIEEKTNGAYTLEIYPNAQLGTDTEMLESCQMGSLDMCVITSSSMASFVPEWGILDLPYVFSSWDHAITWMNSDSSQDLLKSGDALNLHGLGFTGSGEGIAAHAVCLLLCGDLPRRKE